MMAQLKGSEGYEKIEETGFFMQEFMDTDEYAVRN